MAVRELVKLLDSVKLTADEEEIIDLGDSEEGSQSKEMVNVLIGRWVTKKPLNLKGMSNAFLTAWDLRKPSKSGTLVRVDLWSRDKEKVLSNGPWHFEK